MRESRIVDQIEALRDHHPERPIVVFVPKVQIGRSMETALARRRRGWKGVRTLIPRHYAEEVARLDLLRLHRTEAPVAGKLFRAARIAQSLPEEATGALPGWHLLADTVEGAIDTLRENGVRVTDVKKRAGEPGASDTLGVIADCYESYLQELDEKNLYDDASVYQWAAERVRSGQVPREVVETIYAVVGAAELSEHAFLFLRSLWQYGQGFFRLGVERRADPPPKTAASRFQRVSVPEELSADDVSPPDKSDSPGKSDRFVRAVGARREVQSVFRNLLEEETAFEEATIAYADSRPYASLLADEAERLGIPLTMGTGLPAEHTRTGRALRDLWEWAREDYDPTIPIRMLRSGLLRTDRWLRHQYGKEDSGEDASEDDVSEDHVPDIDLPDAEERPSFRPHEAATLLAERSYEPGREGLFPGLTAVIGELEPEREERDLSSGEEMRLSRLRLLRTYVEDLAGLIPEQGEVRELAKNSCVFLQRFGPTDPTGKPEEKRTPDEAARGLLYQRLDRITDIDVSCRASGRRLAALFQQWLSGQYVQAESPRPGHVHVLPLESAGYSDRFELHVVGLDSTTFAAPGAENGMLQEADRRALVSSLGEMGGIVQESTPADEALWRATRALRRHRGRTCLYTRIYDVEAGEQRDPSSLFLQAERIDGRPADSEEPNEETMAGLVPAPDAMALSDADLWLQSYREGRTAKPDEEERPDDDSARWCLQERHPWVLDGEAARQARQSGAYTVHDGLLPEDSYSDLNLFNEGDRPLSASRLETLAEAPYIYFLKYVLGARPLEEPALDEEPWLNRLRKGTLLHEIYERFMRRLGGPATADHAPVMEEIVDEVLAEETEAFAPPSPVVENAARRELMQNATIFLRSEIDRAADYAPERFELGFGFPPRRRESQDEERAAGLSVGDETIRLRGRIDRVDRHRDAGTLAAWDYKTGSASSYDEEEPLQKGRTMQWALYAYALESLFGETVDESGYFFANVKEMGSRISADPDRYRADVESILQRLGDLTETGSFPVTPDLNDVNDWKWGGYDRLVGDLYERRKELKEKDYPDGRPKPPSFE